MNKKRVLVFGSSGFVGSSIFKSNYFNSSYKVIGLNKKFFNLLKKSSIVKIKKIIKKNDYLIFCAGKVPVKNFVDFDINMKIFYNFLETFNIKRIKKIIYISSDAVYRDTRGIITEKSKTEPNSLHGLLHLLRERILINMGKNILILRPTLIYGSNDTHNGYGPNKFIRSVKKSDNIFLFGKGEERRDHIHIDSVVRLIYVGIKNDLKGVYNIASGKIVSFYELAKHINQISGKKIKIIFKKRDGPPPHLGLRRFDITKIKKFFNKKKPLFINKIINESFILNFK